jgi:hypothetical protein
MANNLLTLANNLLVFAGFVIGWLLLVVCGAVFAAIANKFKIVPYIGLVIWLVVVVCGWNCSWDSVWNNSYVGLFWLALSFGLIGYIGTEGPLSFSKKLIWCVAIFCLLFCVLRPVYLRIHDDIYGTHWTRDWARDAASED